MGRLNMPIVKILPDGKVRIANSKTGEVKDVAPEELQKYSPKLVVAYQTLLTSGEVAAAGAKPETSDPIKLALQAQQIASGEYQSPEAIAAAQKLQGEGVGVLGFLDQLKELYNQPNAEGVAPIQGKGNLSYGKENTPKFITDLMMKAKIQFNKASKDEENYKNFKEGFLASLKEATGDTGVLTEPDYVRIAKTLPDFNAKDDVAQKAWETIDNILIAKFGRTGKYSYVSKDKTTKSKTPNVENDPLGLGL